MTGFFLLDWFLLTISLFNTIIMFWLGLTVLFNAEQRNLGVWLAGGSLLLGGAFFVSHTAILGMWPNILLSGGNFWWRVGWVPLVLLPFAWYGVMLWYSGYWQEPFSALRSRQRPWFIFMAIVTIGLTGLLAFANSLPSLTQMVFFDLSATPSIGGSPLLLVIYPVYIILCIALSIDALRQPGPSARVMAEQARRRAHPWLVAASLVMLLVCLLVGIVLVWVVFRLTSRTVYIQMPLSVGGVDLVIASLIGLTTLLLGQAVVSYEVFTGKTLPRRGLERYWRRVIILAAGYSFIVSWSLTFHLRSIYSLLAATLLMTAFYALLSWRSYAERDRFIESLRPFVASQGLVDTLLAADAVAPSEVDAAPAFRALCNDVLNASRAALIPLGPLAALSSGPLLYPPNLNTALPPLNEITPQFTSPQSFGLPLDPQRHNGLVWAVPLWSERGLIGLLLLGPKRDGGLYTQEEIEIARTAGERLVDTRASAEMARRLMALQRQRLAESQVADRRMRRALHDDILPRLHTALLALTSAQPQPDPQTTDALAALAETHRQIANLLHEMPAAAPEVTRLGLVGALHQLVDEEMQGAFDDVAWQLDASAETGALRLPALSAEVLFYAAREALRNAARHGRGSLARTPANKPEYGKDGGRALHLRIAAEVASAPGSISELKLTIEDDGVGLQNGQSGEEGGAGRPAGAGQGLALHSTMMAVVGGTLSIESAPGEYTRVTLALPVN